MRTSCFIIEARTGDRRAAASVVRRALVRIVGQTRIRGTYVSAGEARSLGIADARFVVELTDAEHDAVCEAMEFEAELEGFDIAPVDVYRS